MKTLFIALFISIFVTGCFNNEPPKCSDKEVEVSVKKLYIQVLGNIKKSNNPFLLGFMQKLPQNIQSLSSIRAVAYEEKIKMRSCKAEAIFENNQTASIKFTIQTNEENDDFYVELDTEFLEGLMQESIMQGIFNN